MKIAFIASVLLTVSSQVSALETDQFLATNIVIKDSAPIINEYFNKQIDEAVAEANLNAETKCTAVASMVMDNLVGAKYFGISKISKFARTNPEIEKYPPMSVTDKDYFRMTYYEKADIFMKLADLARTINMNGIYMGTDKLGHFSLIGRNYYHNYLSYRKKDQALSVEEAMKKAILKGFATERGILGYAIGGVLSFGDLESNFEGLRFAVEMCEGKGPYVMVKNNKFVKVRDFDTKNYFNPRQDESFNFSFWRPGLYKRIQPKLKKEYCATISDPMYIERISKYPPIVENMNDRLIKEVILTEKRFSRSLEDVKSYCNE